MQTGEELLLSCGGEEVFLLLVACQVHHPSGDVCYYEHLKREKNENDTGYSCCQVHFTVYKHRYKNFFLKIEMDTGYILNCI